MLPSLADSDAYYLLWAKNRALRKVKLVATTETTHTHTNTHKIMLLGDSQSKVKICKVPSIDHKH